MKGRPPRSRSPQEKKALSYAKDRRNDYGANNKASRNRLPLRKALEMRRIRRKASTDLTEVEVSQTGADLAESSLRQDTCRVGGWKKQPDAPLGAFLARQRRLRAMREDNGSK